ncbi:DUF2510 domain-containing protein [Georgenia alba]|uniref:DUF2510 domain-containing protein n=1 Tax=Georgenia alba TaxID=2233858 RepID=A0ABW2Q337_9MICO
MANPAPGWYPDNADPRFLRWWDGNAWTPHTQPRPQPQPQPQAQQPQAVQHQQPVQPQHGHTPHVHPTQQHGQQAHAQQAQQAHAQQAQQAHPQHAYAQQHGYGPPEHAHPQGGGHHAQQAGGGQVRPGPLFTAPEILIAQQTSVFGISANAGAYRIFDTAGTQIGVFKEPDSTTSRLFDKVNPLADFTAKSFELTDAQGQVLLKVDNPQGFKDTLKPKFHVSAATGPVGLIEQQKVFAGRGFVFTVNGQPYGHFEEAGREGFSLRFICRDVHGNQIAEFIKRSAGRQSFKEIATQDDSYVLLRPQPIPEPLGSLVLISACAMDSVFFERP